MGGSTATTFAAKLGGLSGMHHTTICAPCGRSAAPFACLVLCSTFHRLDPARCWCRRLRKRPTTCACPTGFRCKQIVHWCACLPRLAADGLFSPFGFFRLDLPFVILLTLCSFSRPQRPPPARSPTNHPYPAQTIGRELY